MSDKPDRDVARITKADFEVEDHGIPIWNIQFDYDGSSQGIGGYTAEVGFMMRLMEAVGVTRLSDLKGKSCWVTHTWTEVLAIEPLHKKDGTPFIIADWKVWIEKRGAKLSPYEMRTGKEPKR